MSRFHRLKKNGLPCVKRLGVTQNFPLARLPDGVIAKL